MPDLKFRKIVTLFVLAVICGCSGKGDPAAPAAASTGEASALSDAATMLDERQTTDAASDSGAIHNGT